jgi:hypothetical protein
MGVQGAWGAGMQFPPLGPLRETSLLPRASQSSLRLGSDPCHHKPVTHWPAVGFVVD